MKRPVRQTNLLRFWRDRRGAMLPVIALSFTVILAAGALGIDVSRLTVERSRLQTTADIAARAATRLLPNANAARAEAIAYAQNNMPPQEFGNVLVAQDVEVGSWDTGTQSFNAGGGPPNALRITTRRAPANGNPVPMTLARTFGISQGSVATSAIATQVNAGTACVLALAGSGTGMTIGGNVDITATNCGFAVNSTDAPGALDLQGNAAQADILSMYVVGDYDDPHGTINSTEPPVTNTGAPIPDPYAGVTVPNQPQSPTAFANSKPSNSITLEPGTYPSGFTFKGDVHMEAGIYVMEGDVSVNAQASVTGESDGVTIVLKDSDITVNGGADMDLTAPDSGPTKGLVVMRDGPPSAGNDINGSGALTFTGGLYFPNSQLDFSGTSAANGCLQVVAHRIDFHGNPDFQTNCGNFGTEDINLTVVSLVK